MIRVDAVWMVAQPLDMPAITVESRLRSRWNASRHRVEWVSAISGMRSEAAVGELGAVLGRTHTPQCCDLKTLDGCTKQIRTFRKHHNSRVANGHSADAQVSRNTYKWTPTAPAQHTPSDGPSAKSEA